MLQNYKTIITNICYKTETQEKCPTDVRKNKTFWGCPRNAKFWTSKSRSDGQKDSESSGSSGEMDCGNGLVEEANRKEKNNKTTINSIIAIPILFLSPFFTNLTRKT